MQKQQCKFSFIHRCLNYYCKFFKQNSYINSYKITHWLIDRLTSLNVWLKYFQSNSFGNLNDDNSTNENRSESHRPDSPLEFLLSFFFRADCGSIRAQVKSLGRKSTEKKEERGQKRFLGQMAEMVKEKNQVSEKGREKKYCERMFQTWLAASREFRLHPYIFSSLYGLASSQFETT